MRILFFSLLILLQFSELNAQLKYDYQWRFGFGNNSGSVIDFNSNPLSIFFEDREMEIYLSNASTCNDQGNLLFYTNGCYIANATHNTMMNGDSLNPGHVFNTQCEQGFGYPTSPQSCLILPLPSNEGKYYLFHTRIVFTNGPGVEIITDKLFYSIVDMSLNNGLGAVIEKNTVALDDTLSAGQLTAVKHSNNQDWWIMSSEYIDNKYYRILFTENGITDIQEQTIGNVTVKNGNGGGQAVFSPDGTKYIRYTPADDIFIFDFDRTTGLLSNFQFIALEEEGIFGGTAISSNSRFLYICTQLKIYQYDLEANDIAASRILVAEYDGFTAPFPTTFYQAQLAPDCRIYINSANGVDVLHVINYPNREGLACDVQQHSVQLPTNHRASMPNFPNYRLGTPYPVCDSSILTTISPISLPASNPPVKLYPNPAQEVLNIEFLERHSTSSNLMVELYDLWGKSVLRQEWGAGNSKSIPVTHLPRGVYQAIVSSDAVLIHTEKVIIIR